jgi:hypothetical protein
MSSFFEFLLRFFINLVVLFIIIRLIYYPLTKRKDYLFTYFLIGIIVFLLCFLLENVELKLGFALGLFAIFGIIRYRTDAIPIKEMTYLFIVIGLAVINALTVTGMNNLELGFANLSILTVTFALEKIWLLKNENSKIIIYDKIENITPENQVKLIEDLRIRTGINITRIVIGRIDFVRKNAKIKIFYSESPEEAGFEAEEESWKNKDDF